MRGSRLLLALIPVLGLVELGLHGFFAARPPGFADYAALAAELTKLKPRGAPLVVAPSWAEPLLRQAAPSAFPLEELARPDDSGFARLLEVSLLGEHAPELADLPIEAEHRVGPFRLALHRNPRAEASVFDFVSATQAGQVEVSTRRGALLEPCPLVERAQGTTGGLHGAVARPARRYECASARAVAVTLIEDQNYRPRRCILVDPARRGSVVLRYGQVPPSRKLVGFVGFSYFLGRDQQGQQVELSLKEGGRELGRKRAEAARGWVRFELERPEPTGELELEVRRLAEQPGDFCFALEAR